MGLKRAKKEKKKKPNSILFGSTTSIERDKTRASLSRKRLFQTMEKIPIFNSERAPSQEQSISLFQTITRPSSTTPLGNS